MSISVHDEELKEVQTLGLKWIPWVGAQYVSDSNLNPSILIVGESHYYGGKYNTLDKYNNFNITRNVIKDLAINRNYWGTKMFSNIHKVLFRNDDFKSELFWNAVSFYNFIQRPMETNKGRPSSKDFRDGWKVFFEIINILKPKTILFIGTSAANHLSDAIKGSNYSSVGVKWEEKIGRSYAKTVVINDKDNLSTRIIFIRHASQMFSWKKWNDYLNKTIPFELSYLKECITPSI